jgi:hypothetical protein
MTTIADPSLSPRILKATDPSSFASLVLLNTKWHRVSQQADLYALQLSRCATYAGRTPASLVAKAAKPSVPLEHDDPRHHETADDDVRLCRLRELFAHEVKRGLFAAYMRPAETTVRLVSNSISSSSAPGGEGMQFSSSPRGHHMLAYNSSRIHVLDMRCPAAGDIVRRELGILRRPASTCITDDGTVLAVLSTEMQVDVYDLDASPPRRRQSLILDHRPRTIALSPCGTVVAAAYEGGIEVSSVAPNALPTERRAVKCDAVDALAFSFDGTQLLGTTVGASGGPNTVILTAPYYDPGALLSDDGGIGALWTTSILFPNTSRDCSHAVLLQYSAQEEASWTVAYDRSLETFRAVRVDDLRNGTTYFTGPVAPASAPQSKLLPCTLPAASYRGELVSAGFHNRDVWLYGVPEDLDALLPEAAATTAAAAAGGPSSSSSSSDQPSGPGARRQSVLSHRSSSHLPYDQSGGPVPKWQVLRDRSRNNFVAGAKVVELDGVSLVKWVCGGVGDGPTRERLVVAARGIVPGKLVTDEEDIDFVDGGRVTILDFDYTIHDGERRELTIEVGTAHAEVLEEEQRDLETEVAIVRRRTVAQRKNRTTLLRAATTGARRGGADAEDGSPSASAHSHLMPPLPTHLAELGTNDDTSALIDDDDDPLVPRRVGRLPQTPRLGAERTAAPDDASSPSVAIEVETASLVDEVEALDMPYSQGAPRSGQTLRRAATAAAVNRQRQPEMPTAGRVEYRRADGRREHPHESDADGWVPPPPPYQKEAPVQDLPAFLRQPAVGPGGVVLPPGAMFGPLPPPPLSHYGYEIARPVTQPVVPPSPYRRLSVAAVSPRSPSVSSSAGGWGDDRPRLHRRSVSMTDSRPASGYRPVSGQSSLRFQDSHDVSPPGSPPVQGAGVAGARHSSYVPVPAPLDTRQHAPYDARAAPQSATAAIPSVRPHPALPPLPFDASERIRLAAAENRPMPALPPLPAAHATHAPPHTQPMVSQPWTSIREYYAPQPRAPVPPMVRTNVDAYAAVGGHSRNNNSGAHRPYMGPHSAVEPRQYVMPAWSGQQHQQQPPLPQHQQQPQGGELRPRTEVYYSAGTPESSHDVPDLPPLPRPDQLASFQQQLQPHLQHLHQQHPRRVSPDPRDQGPQHLRHTESDSHGLLQPAAYALEQRPMTADNVPAHHHHHHHPAPDIPLIISTPSGVSGALDGARRPSILVPPAPIFAPIPRRSTPQSLDLRPTVERLEGIYHHGSHSNHTTPNLHEGAGVNGAGGGSGSIGASGRSDSSPLPGMRRRPRSRYRSGLFSILSGGGGDRSESPPPPVPSLPPMPGRELHPQPSSDGSLVGRRKSLMLRRRGKKKRAATTTEGGDVPAVPALPPGVVGLGLSQVPSQGQAPNPLWIEEMRTQGQSQVEEAAGKDKGKGSKCVVM